MLSTRSHRALPYHQPTRAEGTTLCPQLTTVPGVSLAACILSRKRAKKGFWKSGKVFSRVACVFYDGHLSDSTIATSPILRWTPLRPSDSPTPASCCKAFRIGWILNFYLKKKGRNYKNYIWLIFGFLLKQELLGKPYFKKKNRVL